MDSIGHAIQRVARKLHLTSRASRSRRRSSKAHKIKVECPICCETKRQSEMVQHWLLPDRCQLHFIGEYYMCAACLDASLAAQLEAKMLVEVGCLQCGTPWNAEDIKALISSKHMKRFKQLEKSAKERVVVPDVEMLPDGDTMEVLLAKGTRFCPFCRWPFVRAGGCDSIYCWKCNKEFDINYALILEDKEGRRAAKLFDNSDLDARPVRTEESPMLIEERRSSEPPSPRTVLPLRGGL